MLRLMTRSSRRGRLTDNLGPLVVERWLPSLLQTRELKKQANEVRQSPLQLLCAYVLFRFVHSEVQG